MLVKFDTLRETVWSDLHAKIEIRATTNNQRNEKRCLLSYVMRIEFSRFESTQTTLKREKKIHDGRETCSLRLHSTVKF